MASKLNVVARMIGMADLRYCDWTSLRADHIVAIMANLEKNGRTGSTVNCYLAALKGVAKAAWLSHQMPHDELLRINAISQRRYYRLPAGRALSYRESRMLINDCRREDTPIGYRDAAITLLMLGCGLRRGEIPLLKVEDYNREDRSIKLVGKGDKERRVFLPEETGEALNLWIDKVRGSEKGWLFGRIYKNGRLSLLKPLDARSIGEMLTKHMSRAGGDPITAHDLRRTFATRLLADNIDIVTVQKLMGHANVSTTAKYDRRGEDAQRQAARRVRI